MSKDYKIEIILPHYTAPAIWMKQTDAGWVLPDIRFELDEINRWAVSMATYSLSRFSGAEVNILYCLQYSYETDIYGVFVAENCTPDYQPDDGEWISHDMLQNLTLTDEKLHPILERYFHESTNGNYPSERPPWSTRGWHDQAHQWIREQLQTHNLTLTGAITPIHKWCITCLLQVPTDKGVFYFKATPSYFVREISVTQHLHHLFPESTIDILAADETRYWMLMHDFKATLLDDIKDIPTWHRTVRKVARFQLETSTLVDTVDYPGLQNYRLDSIVSQLEKALQHGFNLEGAKSLPPEKIEQIRDRLSLIASMCEKLASYKIPHVLIHNDLHANNLAVRDDSIVIFDWTDASIGHPFFDFRHLLDQIEDDALKETVREVYLQEFTHYAPMTDLLNALTLGEILGLIQQAIHYHWLLQQVEPVERWTTDVIAYYSEKFLDRLDDVASLIQPV